MAGVLHFDNSLKVKNRNRYEEISYQMHVFANSRYSDSGVLFVNENETETKRKRSIDGVFERVLSFFETF